MSQDYRIDGGLIDRSKLLDFRFNEKSFSGFQGDTLASALLANGQKLVGRSFKYHRPRGIFSAGSEEPNALVTLREGAYQEPNTRATIVELFDGLVCKSQNHRGSLENDLMGGLDLLSPFLSAGFYYKTFMWPRTFWEKIYEPFIRASAGLGALSGLEDPDIYDKGFLHCDILVIGSGASGLLSALIAAKAGARVIIAEEDYILGGRLNAETYEIDALSSQDWVKRTLETLASFENVTIMPRTCVFGSYDHGIYGAVERKTDHLKSAGGKPRQILWRIYSKAAILAAGSTERGIAFGNNDRPNIMLAGAVRTYANRFGVTPGKNITIYTNNDDGWRTAKDLSEKNIEISALIDTRENVSHPYDVDVERIIKGGRITNTKGRKALSSITLSNGETISTDCLAVSGGWNPNIHLTCHQNGRPLWNEEKSTFLPSRNIPPNMHVVGAASGLFSLQDCFHSAVNVTNFILKELGFDEIKSDIPKCESDKTNITAFWHVKESKKRAWLDLQNDVTVKDVKLAQQEGYQSVELLKRYTTLGMATDQGKTANVIALAILAESNGKSIAETGITTYRPPYSPISLGVLAGRARSKDFRPTRLTPSDKWAKEQGGVFTEAGLWKRAQWFPLKGETHWRESVDREVIATRNHVGVCDVTTLGKIDIQGNDAAEFLNKVYINGFAKLPIGKVRYGLMLREDGIVMDDGTTARMSENHFIMTTTTAKAGPVYKHLEFCRQVLFPKMDVHLISTTDGWAQFSIAGPDVRKLLLKIVDKNHDISNEAFPYMACGEITICNGVRARLFRISFSGEHAYELAVPSRYGDSLIRVLADAIQEFDGVVYGTEALGVMRVEKGHAAGNELNGQTTAANLGMERMLSKKKDCIGNILSQRDELSREDGLRLVGFKPVDKNSKLSSGAHFLAINAENNMDNDQGYMTSVAYSPILGHSIGLGYIENGSNRMGEKIRSVDFMRGTEIEVEITSPHFYDPEGERLRV